ncbi:MAG: hypothetical protein ACODAD_08565, partial [Planctomycetota bacterium]
IPRSLEFDIDFLYLIREYHDDHEKIVNPHEIRQQIYRSIVAYMTLPEREADVRIFRCQTGLVNDSAGLLDAFPPEDDSAWKLFALWDVINEEVLQRHQVERPVSMKNLCKNVFALCRDLDLSNQIGGRHVFEYYLLTKGPYVLFFILPILLLWQWLYGPMTIGIAIALGVIATIAGHFFLKPYKLFEKSIERRVKRFYQKNWRERFIQVLEANQATHDQLVDAFRHVLERHHDRLGFTRWLYQHIPVDAGLAFYAIATKFSH